MQRGNRWRTGRLAGVVGVGRAGMSGCVTSYEPCTGDPWHARADGEVLARCVCGTRREHHRQGARRGRDP